MNAPIVAITLIQEKYSALKKDRFLISPLLPKLK